MTPTKYACLALTIIFLGCGDGGDKTRSDSGPESDAVAHFDGSKGDWKTTFSDMGRRDGLVSPLPDTLAHDGAPRLDTSAILDSTIKSDQLVSTCGDGVLQGKEKCDDKKTKNCLTDHDGGGGVCMPAGKCVSGYVIDSKGACIKQSTTGLKVPCSQKGYGWTVFRFHYGGGNKSAQVDVWDASCSYSFAPNSACNVREVYPGFGSVSYNAAGYPIFTTTHYLRVRYSVAGLKFKQATLFVQARSYATASSTKFRAWSPLYGDVAGGPVDNDWIYDWYGVDWSKLLTPYDKPSLTAIQIYATGGSGKLAVKAMELCVK